MEEKIKELEARIEELEAWKQARQEQQLTHPLDDASRNVINRV